MLCQRIRLADSYSEPQTHRGLLIAFLSSLLYTRVWAAFQVKQECLSFQARPSLASYAGARPSRMKQLVSQCPPLLDLRPGHRYGSRRLSRDGEIVHLARGTSSPENVSRRRGKDPLIFSNIFFDNRFPHIHTFSYPRVHTFTYPQVHAFTHPHVQTFTLSQCRH